MATVDRLATQFDYCIEEAVGLIVSLPDGDYKQDLLHVSPSVTVIFIISGHCVVKGCGKLSNRA